MPNPHRLQHFRVEVAQVHAVVLAGLPGKWLPMRDAAACCAAHGCERSVALHVLLGVLGMPGDSDGAEFIVGPDRTQAAADRAVAAGGLLRSRRQLDGDGPAMAGSSEHVART